MEDFMLQRDRLALGCALKEARSVIVADDSFAVLATIAPTWRAHI
jgi:hypothetical protein